MSFANLLFLAGGVAVVVPFAIHLIHRRRWEQVSIGSLRFLQEAMRTSRRMSRVENWPLLLLRMLMVLLLALIFARPYIEQKEKKEEVTGGENIILLDSSGSLVGWRKEVLSLAREVASDFEEDSVRFLAFADEVKELPEIEGYDAIAGAPTNWGKVIDWVFATASGGDVGKVVVVTDGREGGLGDAPERLWPSTVDIEFQRIPNKQKGNAAVMDVELLTEYRGEETIIEARVEVEGEWSGFALLELKDGRRKSVEVPVGGGRVVFAVDAGPLSRSDKLLQGKVSLQTGEVDSWRADDTRYFSFLERVRKKILILDGDPGVSPFTSEGYFLSQALLASSRGPGQSPFIPVIQNDFRLQRPRDTEENWDAIVMCNWLSLTSLEAKVLDEWNKEGTGIVVVLGDQSHSQGYQSLVELGLFPNGLTRQEVATPRSVEVISKGSRSMEGLAELGVRMGDLFLRDGFRFSESKEWVKAVALRGGGGLVYEKKGTEDGLVMVVAHPLTREWGDFPISRWFVPLVTEWTKAASGGSQLGLRVESLVTGLANPEQGIFESEGKLEVVNADLGESKVTVLSDEEFKVRLGIPLEVTDNLEIGSIRARALPKERERAHEFWPWLLILLVFVGLFEMWFSDFRKPSPQNI